MKSVGIAGTAKNSGKTTTLSAILEELSLRNINLGLTSIGYDGERVDNVTGLPKPALTMLPGQWVATAARCLKQSSAKIRVVEETGILTPLGRLIIGQVERWGSIVLAGPNKSSELKWLLIRFKELGIKLGLVDGALNRLVPMAVTNGLILATGASRHQDVTTLAKETAVINSICGLSRVEVGSFDNVGMIGSGSEIKQFNFRSILDNAQVDEMISEINYKTKKIIIPGIIGEKQIDYLSNNISTWHGVNIVFANPLKLLVSADLTKLEDFIRKIRQTGGKIQVIHQVPLISITVNPFYPRFRYQHSDYEPAYINAERLFSKIQEAVDVLVVNVQLHGAKKLVDNLIITLKL